MYPNPASSRKLLPSDGKRISCVQILAKWFDKSQPAERTGVQALKDLVTDMKSFWTIWSLLIPSLMELA